MGTAQAFSGNQTYWYNVLSVLYIPVIQSDLRATLGSWGNLDEITCEKKKSNYLRGKLFYDNFN